MYVTSYSFMQPLIACLRKPLVKNLTNLYRENLMPITLISNIIYQTGLFSMQVLLFWLVLPDYGVRMRSLTGNFISQQQSEKCKSKIIYWLISIILSCMSHSLFSIENSNKTWEIMFSQDTHKIPCYTGSAARARTEQMEWLWA